MMNFFSKDDLDRFTATRLGEEKIGQTSTLLHSWSDLDQQNAPFVLIGIKEDIGIRANLGTGGASDCWDYAVKALVNVQSNSFLKGNQIIIAGTLDFKEFLEEASLLDASKTKDLERLRALTALIDKEVSNAIEIIVKAGKVPIVIGGGHNNAFGNINGTSNALNQGISVLNIDPHTDFRALEGRHSGNGFRYAKEAGKLDQYAVYGLHEGYNGESIIQEFNTQADLHFQSFESLLWRDTKEQDALFKNVLNWFTPTRIGLELDLDSITGFPVSALNPSGFTLNEIRNHIRTAASIKSPYYFHICEGSPGRATSQQQKDLLGKSIAYLITDFIKSYT